MKPSTIPTGVNAPMLIAMHTLAVAAVLEMREALRLVNEFRRDPVYLMVADRLIEDATINVRSLRTTIHTLSNLPDTGNGPRVCVPDPDLMDAVNGALDTLEAAARNRIVYTEPAEGRVGLIVGKLWDLMNPR